MSMLVKGISLPFDADAQEALDRARVLCGVKTGCPASVYRSSVDARHGRPVRVYSVLLQTDENEQERISAQQNKNILVYLEPAYAPVTGSEKLEHAPVVAGFGPAGMFAALVLALHGYKPLVLERGGSIQERDDAVKALHERGVLCEENNIQFGEGGAGTYSDGKLTTRIHDVRCRYVLSQMHRHGAPEEILTEAYPHVGTDRIGSVVSSIRREIEQLGGRVLFHTRLDEIRLQGGRMLSVRAGGAELPARQLILATGHSARDTYAMLFHRGVEMQPKSFSAGVRIEHLQQDIDSAMYGKYAGHPSLGPASYRLVHHEQGASCYSFCMCPGGTVVAAASESGGVVTNGMSVFARNGVNANAALAVSVDAGSFFHPFDGIEFQRRLERDAYAAGGGTYAAPVQTVGDFLQDRTGSAFTRVHPTYPAGVVSARLDAFIPPGGAEVLRRALRTFGRKIRGFDRPDAVLTAPETRTSAPVRLLRAENLYSRSIEGLIPCGEGAGYAGGIVSAAVDGMRAAEAIMARFAPLE